MYNADTMSQPRLNMLPRKAKRSFYEEEKGFTVSGWQRVRPLKKYSVKRNMPKLYLSLLEEPVLDGFDHIGEDILHNYVELGVEKHKEILLNIVKKSAEGTTADMVRLLSRLKPFDSKWRVEFIKKALTSACLEVRDGAIQAIENWEEDELVALLKQHKEKDSFLRDYAHQVVEDLEG